jgi:hypothetical protein
MVSRSEPLRAHSNPFRILSGSKIEKELTWVALHIPNLPSVQQKPLFVSFFAERYVVTKVNKLISTHTSLRFNLNRIGTVDER